MADKVLINLATGMEDAERVLVAFLVATAALAQDKQVVVWTTKDAARLALPGEMAGVACKGRPPAGATARAVQRGRGRTVGMSDLPQRAGSGRLGDSIARTHSSVGATPMWEWAGNDTTVFSY